MENSHLLNPDDDACDWFDIDGEDEFFAYLEAMLERYRTEGVPEFPAVDEMRAEMDADQSIV